MTLRRGGLLGQGVGCTNTNIFLRRQHDLSSLCVNRLFSLSYYPLDSSVTTATMAKDSTPAKASEKAQEVAADNGMFVSLPPSTPPSLLPPQLTFLSSANPSQSLIALFSTAYLAFVPITSLLTRPSSPLTTLLPTTLRLLVPGLPASPPPDKQIAALSALYAFWALGATGAFSVAGQGMSRPQGLDNDNPRAHVHGLSGLPLRLRSAHVNLLENFGGFALAAGLAVAKGGGDQQVVNLLGLYVIVKGVVYYFSYLAGLAPVRTVAHFMAVSAVMNVCWRLATVT